MRDVCRSRLRRANFVANSDAPPPSRRPRYAQAFALALLALGEPAIARGAVEGGPAATAATATETDATTTVTIHLAVPPAADAGTPRVTRVTIDGRAASLDVPIEVTAGPHVVRLELEGRAADERTITVHAGDHVELALDGVIAPPREPPMLGGAPPPVQSRGGCAGCGGGHDASSATLGAGSLALGVVLAKGRRRRPRTARRSRS